MQKIVKEKVMSIDEIYSLVEEIEKDKRWLFIVYPKRKRVGVDVLDWESEDCVDGGWFNSKQEAFDFIKKYKNL